MKIVEETETEIYIEVEVKELPLTIDTKGKQLFARIVEYIEVICKQSSVQPSQLDS